MKIYPNPTKGLINISFNKNAVIKEQLNVYDTNGKLVKQVLFKAIGGLTTIDLTDLEEGVYFIETIINNEPLVCRVELSLALSYW